MSDTPEDNELETPNDPIIPPVDPVDPAPPKDRFKEDLFKQKEANRALQEKIDLQNRQIEDARTSKMKEQEQFKELYEEEQRKREEAEAKSHNLSQAVLQDRKYSAIKTEALQSGIRKEALNDLDLLSMDTIEVETTSTGRVNVLNAKEYVENLKITKPHWFGKRSTNLNATDPEVLTGSGLVTLQMIKKAEQEYKKTGDMTVYNSLLVKYKQQPR